MMSYKSSFFFSIFVYAYKVGEPLGKRLFLRTAGYTDLRRLCTQAHAKGSHVDGCCFAAAYGIRPWTPWIWGILNFRSIRV